MLFVGLVLDGRGNVHCRILSLSLDGLVACARPLELVKLVTPAFVGLSRVRVDAVRWCSIQRVEKKGQGALGAAGGELADGDEPTCGRQRDLPDARAARLRDRRPER